MQSDAEQIAEAVSDLYEPDRILARAACRWWDAARPQNWTLEQHLEHPTAYTWNGMPTRFWLRRSPATFAGRWTTSNANLEDADDA